MDLNKLLEDRANNRPHVTIALRDFLACDDESPIKLRVLSAGEEVDATKRAVEYRRSMLSQLPEKFVQAILDDPGMFGDVDSIEKLSVACRNADDVSKAAFPSSKWMMENMTREELQALWGFYEHAVIKASKTTKPITDSELDVIQAGAAANAGSDDPDRALMGLSKPVLADIAVRLAVRASERK